MKLTQEDKDRIGAFYLRHLEQYGPQKAQSLSWTDESAQQRRFEILAEIGNLEGKKILDVGSGLGDLYFFLKQNFNHFFYLGVELVPELFSAAREKYPEAKFVNQDFLEFSAKPFDYALSSGALSFKVPQYKEKYFQMIAKMYKLAQKGVAFNMLNRRGHIDDETYAAYDTEEILAFCRQLTTESKVINHYSLQDFTVYLYH